MNSTLKSMESQIEIPRRVFSLALLLETGHGFMTITFPELLIILKYQQKRVRATSLLCLLGLGLGLGSVLLYKLYTRVLSPAISAVRGRKRPLSPDHDDYTTHSHHTAAETPDSGIYDGTSLTQAVSSNFQSPEELIPENGKFNLRQRQIGSFPEYGSCDQVRRPVGFLRSVAKRQSGNLTSSAFSDQGFISGGERLSRFFSDQESIGAHSLPEGTFHSTPQSPERSPWNAEHLKLRRNNYSQSSNLSALTGYSIQDSMYSDYSNQSSLLKTPQNLFELDESSTSNMEQLHQEIRMIREEISEMNERVQVLNSREDMKDLFMLTPNPMKDIEGAPPLRLYRHRHPHMRECHGSGDSRSCISSVDDEADYSQNHNSYHHQGEYMWDYRSDLATDDSLNFVAQRPLKGESAADVGDTIDYNSPTFDHVRKYIESCCNANIDVIPSQDRKSSAPKSRTFNSITDMYIDDSLSDYSFALDGNQERRNIPDGCYSTTANASEFKENVTKQLSISEDCDNNGNHSTVFSSLSFNQNCMVNPAHETCTEHSICMQCGSPSHRRKCREITSAKSNSGGNDGSQNSNEASQLNINSSFQGLQQTCANCGHNTIQSNDAQGVPQPNKRHKWQIMNVCQKVNIFEYVEKRFRGDAPQFQVMKKGYHQIPRLLGMSQIRPIRGDNYCVLRAVLYQICVNNYDVLRHIGTLPETLHRLSVFEDPQYSFLHTWSFANRLPYDADRVLERVQECIQTFYKEMAKLSRLQTPVMRESVLLELLNYDPESDLKLLEAMKVLMMLEAIDMYEMFTGRNSAPINKPPVFVWLMYSRQSSQSPEALFTNHINCLGDIHPAQQVELFLLGYTLGIKIEIVRPPRYGHDDFISHYPDDGADGFPTVYVVGEDDRHYHTILA